MASISLCWVGLTQAADQSLAALLQSSEFERATAISDADICILGSHIRQPDSSFAHIIIRQQRHPLDIDQQADFLLPCEVSPEYLMHVLKQAISQLQLKRQNNELMTQLIQGQKQFERLMGVGLALSAEQDHQALLERILTEARRFGECDAASIFLIERHDEQDQLVFKLTQNDSMAVDFEEQSFALDTSSLAGQAALTGEILNFEDVYHLPIGERFQFNRDFDEKTGYRTRSMLVIPMSTHDGRTLGVIQFINRKREAAPLLSPEQTEQQTLAFDTHLQALLQTVVSQAAIAIENNLLIERVNHLFEGFVSASVHAIEQRDPTTSGHSFRVAELTTALAEAATRDVTPPFGDITFTVAELRELRYAALLHDFGKVGVREHVLVKAKKLTPLEYMRVQYRITLQRERIKNQYLQNKLQQMQQGALSSAEEERLIVEETQALQQLDSMRLTVEQANEPNILADETLVNLQALRDALVYDLDGHSKPLLSEQEFLALAVKQGSLTQHERQEIESHVNHTINFLQAIPWTPELENVPRIAGAHHEKLDGSGYPDGLVGQQIPMGARIMTICDIFDALTASDRPYKTALPLNQALAILAQEAAGGKIDADLYQLFCQLPHQFILPSLKVT